MLSKIPGFRIEKFIHLPALLVAMATIASGTGCGGESVSEATSAEQAPLASPAAATTPSAPETRAANSGTAVSAQPVVNQPAPAKAPASPPTPPDLPARPGVAVPDEDAAASPADKRRETWLSEQFRCRAISTVRFRKCRFEATENGHRLRFQKKDVVCEDVVFDENGDPAELKGCRSGWLKIPSDNKLKPDRDRVIWSGSRRGWRWKDGEKYCCPGLWLEAPTALR